MRPGAGCLLAGPLWCGVVERVKVGELLEIVELCPVCTLLPAPGVHCHTLQGRGRAAVWDAGAE